MRDTNEEDFAHLDEVNADMESQQSILEGIYVSAIFSNLTAHFPNNSPEQN
jgi:hypothetical protein